MFAKLLALIVSVSCLFGVNIDEKYKIPLDSVKYLPKDIKLSDRYIVRLLDLEPGNINEEQKKEIFYLYQKEKVVRDSLIVLYKYNYKYDFMPYIASLTHIHLYIIEKLMDKYNIPYEKKYYTGEYCNEDIYSDFVKKIKEAEISKKTAGEVSVYFMDNIIKIYNRILSDNIPFDVKRILIKINSFNRKVYRRFKKGLRNIQIGLPIE